MGSLSGEPTLTERKDVMSMNGPGMWMPKQKDGKNWELFFSVEVLASGEKIVDRRKSFRVQADAYDWIAKMKNLSVESNEVKEPSFRAFSYTSPKAA